MENFYYCLSSSLKSGMDLCKALEIGTNRSSELSLNARRAVINEITGGKNLSEALKTAAGISEFDTAVISAGEHSGALSEALFRLSEFHKNRRDERMSLIKNLIPSIIGLEGLIVALNIPLLFSCSLNAFINKFFFWNFIIIMAVAAIYGIFIYLRNNSLLFCELLFKFDFFMLPNIYRYKIFNIIFFLFHTLYKAGFGYIKTFSVLNNTAANMYVKDRLINFEIIAKRDEPLERIFQKNDLFDSIDSDRLIVGEKTGTLDIELKKLCDGYEKNIKTVQKLFLKQSAV